MSYDNTNRGQIWPNERKETDRHPDFTGSLDVEGVEYWVSAWRRRPDANPKAPSLSFSVKKKDVQGQSHSARKADPNGFRDEPDSAFPEDDIPF